MNLKIQISHFKNLKEIIPYLLPYKLRICIALICLLLTNLANLGMPILFKEIIDSMASTAKLSGVLIFEIILASYIGLRIFASLMAEIKELIFIRITQNVIQEIYLNTHRHLLNCSYNFHTNRETGLINQYIEQGIRGIQSLIGYSLHSVVPTAIEFILIIVYFYIQYDFRFSTILFLGVLIYFVYTNYLTKILGSQRLQINELDARVHQKGFDLFANFVNIKISNSSNLEISQLNKKVEPHKNKIISSKKMSSVLNFGQQLILGICIGLTLLLSIRLYQLDQLSIGNVVLINSLVIQLFIPLNTLGGIYQEIRHALADMQSLFQLFNIPTEDSHTPYLECEKNSALVQAPPFSINFKNLDFNYENKNNILDNFSLNIPANSLTALVGISGCGKSTLGKLLVRFYEPQIGSILINDTDIQYISKEYLRSMISYIPQETQIFNDYLFNNIIYPLHYDSIDDLSPLLLTRIHDAINHAELTEYINNLPLGLNTPLGENGLKISGGERQRIALARAFFEDKPILFLDESTSALDLNLEMKILNYINSIKYRKTIVMIAHRLSTITNADQIAIIHKGEVINNGKHFDLIAHCEIYKILWNSQKINS